jgi:hypothetical protein
VQNEIPLTDLLHIDVRRKHGITAFNAHEFAEGLLNIDVRRKDGTTAFNAHEAVQRFRQSDQPSEQQDQFLH